MKTPGVLSFLHMLFTVGMLWLASTYDVFDVSQLTAAAAKGCIVRAAITGLQVSTPAALVCFAQLEFPHLLQALDDQATVGA